MGNSKSILRKWLGGSTSHSMTARMSRPRFECLEDRCLLSIGSPLDDPAWFAELASSAKREAQQIVWQGHLSDVASGEWMVQLTPEASLLAGSVAGAESVLNAPMFTSHVVRGLGVEGALLIRVEQGVNVDMVTEWLGNDPHVAYYAPNGIVKTATTIPDDTYFEDYLWSLNNTSQTGGTLDADIDAPEAWDITTGDSSLVIAVIDSGVDYTHPDLADNIWVNSDEIPDNGIDDDDNGFIDDIYGWDFCTMYDGLTDSDPMDENFHGTHVAGTIAAVGDNAMGVTGVAWHTQIMSIRFLDTFGDGYSSDAVAAVNYVTMMRRDHGVTITAINASWGGELNDPFLYDAIEASGEAGILFVTAAGNGGMDHIGDDNDMWPQYPASYDLDNIITVAATDHNDDLAVFSNYGAITVDLGAPGVSILSTFPTEVTGGMIRERFSTTHYETISGTSMATPHVSGVVALLYSLLPDSPYQRIRDAILDSVDPLTSLDGITVTGGRLNAFGALQALGMQIVDSSPADGEVIPDPVTDFTVTFSEPYLVSSIDAGDLVVNGVPADGYTLTDAYRVTFHYTTSPVVVQGPQSMGLSAGVILRERDSQGNDAWSAEFAYEEPSAYDDAVTTNEDIPLLIPVTSLMANDINPSPFTGNPVWFDDFTQPHYGTLALVEPEPPSGPVLLYDPDEDFYGVDTFTYCLTDGFGYYDWATVTITVNPIDDGPRAVLEESALCWNESRSGLLAYDVDGDLLSGFVYAEAAHGQLDLEFNGPSVYFTYTPDVDWYGIDHAVVEVTGGTKTLRTELTFYVSATTDDLVSTVPMGVDPSLPWWTWRARSVAISGNRVIIGQGPDDVLRDQNQPVLILEEQDPLTLDPGESAWKVVAEPWTENIEVIGPGEITDSLGCSVAIAGDTAVIGAMGADAAYIYQYDGVEWVEIAKLMPPVEEGWNLRFGYSVAIDEEANTIVVGAPGSYYGGAYIWEYVDSQWQYVQKIAAYPLMDDDQFGASVAISGDRIVVGAVAHGDDSSCRTGYGFVFESVGGTWQQTQILAASDGAMGDSLGVSAAIDGDTVLLGAPYWNGSRGAVYLFELDGSPLQTETEKITLTTAAVNDWFGASVDLDGDQILIGKPQQESWGVGAAYLIDKNDLQGDWETSGLLSVDAGDSDLGLGTSVALGEHGPFLGAPGYGEDHNGAAYLFAKNRTPVVDDLEFLAFSSSINEELVGIDPFEQSDLTFWLWDGDDWVNSGPIYTDWGTITFDTNLGTFTYEPQPLGYSGPDSFTYKVNDGLSDSNIGTVTIHLNKAPAVVGVSVGYGAHEEEIPAVADGADQIKVENVPFREGITTISITFDQDVFVFEDELTVRAGRKGPNPYSPAEWWDVQIQNFNYNYQTYTATWWVETISRAFVEIVLSDLVCSSADPGLHLDGEWENPTSHTDNSGNSTFPSGNGMSGEDFVFHFAVPGSGDFDLDGLISWGDYDILMAHMNQGPGMLWSEGDATGDGWVNVHDHIALFSQWDTDLRTWPTEPPPGPLPPPKGMSLALSAAIEQYLAEESTDANRMKLRRLVDDLFESFGLDMDTAVK